MPIAINGSGTITGVSVGGLPDGIVDTDMLAAGAVTAAKRGAGAILQVVHVEKTDHFSASTSTMTFHDLMSASITPSSTSNKILVHWNSNYSVNNSNQRGGFRILRGSTAIGLGDAAGNRIRMATSNMITESASESRQAVQMLLDSPSTTSAVTYKLQVAAESGAGVVSVNRSENSSDTNTFCTGSSHIVLMEVAA